MVRPFPGSRRLVTAAVRAGRRIVPMHGLIDVDITAARRLLAERAPPLSVTAFVVASLGRAAAAHPEVHAYRDWRGRLVQHRWRLRDRAADAGLPGRGRRRAEPATPGGR